MPLKYKLVDQNRKTRNNTHWPDGATVKVSKPGNKLCSDQVLHWYESPEAAVMFNPIHAEIENPILLEVKGRSVAFDGLKGGSKSLTVIREIPLPEISTNARVRFAIYCAKTACRDAAWNRWADNWLSGKDRGYASAAAEATAWASEATAWASEAASWASEAAEAASWAAAKAAEAEAAGAASWAAWASWAAAKAAEAEAGATVMVNSQSINFTKLIRQAIADE